MVQIKMSYLSSELQSLLDKYGLYQKDVGAKHATIHPKKRNLGVSKLSRIFNGTQGEIKTADLDDLIDAIAQVEEEKAVLLKARLRDLYDGKYASLVKINIRGGAPSVERFTPNDVSGPPVLNQAVRDIYAEALKDAAFAKTVIGLADLVNRGKR